jgi:predicted esterase
VISRNNRKILVAAVILILVMQVSIKAQDFTKGRVKDTVKCIDHPEQSYTLFLPPFYTKKKSWPVIMIFDPGARGNIAVNAFRQAAGNYGYILACSHNSRNGPLNNNFAAAGFLLADLSKRFTIDIKRIFVAGFSGGSRFALALASTNEFVAGVIGCGAGLPNDKNLFPHGKSTFAYYGIAGNKDMNYLEMFDLMTFFNTRTPVINYLRTFNGGHEWPPPGILQEAVEWINLQTINRRLADPDTAYTSYYANKIKSMVNKLIETGNQFDAARYIQYAIRDFSGLKILPELKTSNIMIEQSKEYREANREWLAIASQEREMNEKYFASVRDIANTGSVHDTIVSWWKQEIRNLIQIREKSNPQKSQMASRLLNFISILCSERASSYYRQKQNSLSAFLFGLCTLADSENMNNYYNLARSLSASNKKSEAIDALNKAIEHGYTSKKTVELESVFNGIRNERGFKLLLLRLK